MAPGIVRSQSYGAYNRACQAYDNEFAPRRSISQPGGTVSPCLDRHFATASALFLHREGVSSDARLEVPLPPNCQDPKTSSAIRWDGFLSRGFGMESTGVTRQARLETRSSAGGPITLDLAYSACVRGGLPAAGILAKLQLWPVTAEGCDELTPGLATPTATQSPGRSGR